MAIKPDPIFGLDLDALEDVVENYPIKACWLMTHYQNPLGGTMPIRNKKRLVDILNHRQIVLIEDDVYGELYFGNQQPVAAKSLDTLNNFFHCSSFSKCLAPCDKYSAIANCVGTLAETVLIICKC